MSPNPASVPDQVDSRNQFYLYRARLRPNVVVRKGWLVDPSDWLGDVVLTEVCPPGIDVARYLNYHEDPGGISLAMGRNAIASVQKIVLPPPGAGDDDWAREVVVALGSASDEPVPANGKLARFMPPSSPRTTVGRELGQTLAGRLPINLRRQFESAVSFAEGDDPSQWASRAAGLLGLVEDPQRVLAALDAADEHHVSATNL